MSNKTYQIATEINGAVIHLKIPKSTFDKANEQAIRLRRLATVSNASCVLRGSFTVGCRSIPNSPSCNEPR